MSNKLNVSDSTTVSTVRLWHVTRQEDVETILHEGLQPRIGPRSQALGEPQAAIYLFPDGNSLWEALSNWLQDQFGEDEKLSLLEVSVPCTLVRKDEAEWEARLMQPVSSNWLRVLVADIDAWDGTYPTEEITGGHIPEEWSPGA
jgi:hypothetical protein